MKYILTTLAIFITFVWYSSSQTCKTYQCGSISHEGEYANNVTCVNIPSATSTSIDVEPCKTGQFCSAVEWSDVSQAIKSAKCLNNTYPIIANDTILPGDFCTNSTQCFNSKNGANCSAYECVAALKVNDTCPTTGSNTDHRYCPVGTYCDPTAKKCLVVKTLGQSCADLVECLPGLACVATNSPKYDNYTCIPYFSLDNGKSFSNKYMNDPNGVVIGSSSMCKTYNHVNISSDITIRECRLSDKSYGTTKEDFKRSGTNQTCGYNSWSVKGATFNTSVASSDTAKCGFNKDTSTWCPMRKGDKFFTDAYARFMTLNLTDYKCHVLSDYKKCTDFIIYKGKKEALIDFGLTNLSSGADGLFHLYANNDKCVAKAITTKFWGNSEPDSAWTHPLYTTFIAIACVVAMIALF